VNDKYIKTLFENHPRPWRWKMFGPDDEFIRDSNGNALVTVGFNSSQREVIGELIIDVINKLKKA